MPNNTQDKKDKHYVAWISICFVTWCLCQHVDQPRGPWTLVFKAVRGKYDPRHASVTAFLTSTDTINEDSLQARTDFTLSSEMYKSTLAHDWTATSVQAVKVSFFKNNTEQFFAVFDAHGKMPSNWFDCSNLIEISISNFTSETKRACVFDEDRERKFYLGGVSYCKDGFTWMKDIDANNKMCPFFDELTLHDRPYFLYSKINGDWDPDNDLIPDSYAYDSADTLAIFVQAWTTAMKGGMGSMYDLWTESAQVDTDTSLLTKSNFKSHLVESWGSRFIDQVKFALYNSGVQKAFVVFSATNSSRNDWFDCSNILYSSYSDLNSSSSSLCSMAGEDTRHFVMLQTIGTCANEKTWVVIIDDETNVTSGCLWDNVTKPQYFYSTEPNAVETLQGNSLSPQLGVADVAGIFIHDWHLVVKVATGGLLGPFSSIYDLWTNEGSLNDNIDDAVVKKMSLGSVTFKSFLVDDWETRYIKAVKLAFYKDGQEEVNIVFDATAATKTSWFNCDKILSTSYSGLQNAVCSLDGNVPEKRRFLVSSTTTDCAAFAGWQIIIDKDSPRSCNWEQGGTKPLFLYSSNTETNATNMQRADVMAIFIDTDECNPNPCKNGGICEDIVADFNCTCINNYYGKTCKNLDGNYTTWSSWGTCSASCAPGGTQIRSRTCTSPAPEFGGLNCTDAYIDFQLCNDIPCPVDGNFTTWTLWGTCSAACAPGGTRTRSRTCTNPAPEFGGLNCTGAYIDSQRCNDIPCPVDGGFGTWSDWSICPTICSPGAIQARSRTCTNPSPEYNGQNCTGAYTESRSCDNSSCTVYGNWSDYTWQSCDVTCGTGMRIATRTCLISIPGACSGSDTLTKECQLKPCTCSREDNKYDCFWDRRSLAAALIPGAYWIVLLSALIGHSLST